MDILQAFLIGIVSLFMAVMAFLGSKRPIAPSNTTPAAAPQDMSDMANAALKELEDMKASTTNVKLDISPVEEIYKNLLKANDVLKNNAQLIKDKYQPGVAKEYENAAMFIEMDSLRPVLDAFSTHYYILGKPNTSTDEEDKQKALFFKKVFSTAFTDIMTLPKALEAYWIAKTSIHDLVKEKTKVVEDCLQNNICDTSLLKSAESATTSSAAPMSAMASAALKEFEDMKALTANVTVDINETKNKRLYDALLKGSVLLKDNAQMIIDKYNPKVRKDYENAVVFFETSSLKHLLHMFWLYNEDVEKDIATAGEVEKKYMLLFRKIMVTAFTELITSPKALEAYWMAKTALLSAIKEKPEVVSNCMYNSKCDISLLKDTQTTVEGFTGFSHYAKW